MYADLELLLRHAKQGCTTFSFQEFHPAIMALITPEKINIPWVMNVIASHWTLMAGLYGLLIHCHVPLNHWQLFDVRL